MKFFGILLVWLTLTPATQTDHDFYLSVTDITYVKKEKSLQIISRVFTDDFENVINKRYDKDFKLIPTLEVEEIDFYIEKYIRDKFILETKSEVLSFEYVGRKYEDDMVYLFLEVKNLENFEALTIENSILTDLFQEQKNMIHFKSDNFKKSFILEKDISKKTILHN